MRSILITMLTCVALESLCQSKTETITKELSFEVKGPANALIIENINGSIYAEAYSGSTVVLEVEKVISGKTEARIEKGVKEIQLGVIDRADTLILYIQGPCLTFGNKKQHRNNDNDNGGWGYDWNNCRDQHQEYDYKMNFKIKVPASVSLLLQTINEGNVEVKNVTGTVRASNINGSISLTGVNEVVNATTINGDVDVVFSSNPKNDSRFYSLNGDINALFKKGLSSRLSFKSFNGEFYTNLLELVSLPVEVEKSESDKGVKYKINGNRFQTGRGGANLDFETFNGNVYLKEQ